MKRLLGFTALAALLAAAYLAGRLGVLVAGQRVVAVEKAPVGGLATASSEAPPALISQPVDSVILLVADGVGVLQTTAAGMRAFGAGGRFHFERLPVVGLVATHSLDGLVASSDSAATALASGRKTHKGRIGTGPDGSPLRSVLEAARDAGMATGLVTSAWILDATPAAFATHVERRRDYLAIVEQLADSGVELLAGGGRGWFQPLRSGGERTDGRDLLVEAEERGIDVVRTAEEWQAAEQLPVWALFPGKKLGEEPRHPDIGELAGHSIELLAAEAERRGTGFFLVIEEEGVDTYAHTNRLDDMARALLRFDRAVEAATRFAAADQSTLVLVVGDHSTGGPVVLQASTAEELQVLWASTRHGGEQVPIYAYGPPQAATRFAGVLDNTEIGLRLADILGLSLADDEGETR